MKHPLGIVALLYTTGLLLAEALQPPLALLFTASFVLCAAAIFFGRQRALILCPLIICIGWTNLAWRQAVVSPHDLRWMLRLPAEEVVLRGTLAETPARKSLMREDRDASRTLAVLDVAELWRNGTWEPAHGRVVVFTPGLLGEEFFSRQRVQVSGVASEPSGAFAEGLFDYRTYLRRQGIYFQLRVADTNGWSLGEPALTEKPVADRFLAWAQATLSRSLPEPDEPLQLLWAMTLGWRTGMTSEVYEPFMQSGTMHIFAISGLHIALIAGILVAVLRVVRVSRLWCGVVVIPLIWFYTGATGWQSSAIRSTIMMTIIVGGWALRRPSNLLNSLAAAACVILVLEPQELFQASFQLSFFVVLSIALLLPPIEKWREKLFSSDPLRPEQLRPRWQKILWSSTRPMTTALVTSLAAWLGSWPLTAYYFHLFSPVTLLANLMIVPLSSLALACNLGSLACGGWLPWATTLFNHSGWFWMWLMVRISHWCTSLPAAFFYVKSPGPLDFAIYYVLLFGLLSGWFNSARRKIALGILLVFVAGFYWQRWNAAEQSVIVTVIPWKGSTAIFADAPGRENDLLVDCGNTNAVVMATLPVLHARGVNSLPRLALTHGDLKHIGGTERLCNSIRVDEVVTSPVRFRSPTYRRILRELPDRPESWISVKRGDTLGAWQVLHPAAEDKFPQADDAALVLRTEFEGTRLLLLSDLGRPGQNQLMEREPDLRADVVVAGLPEKGEPLCDALIEKIKPGLIVVVDADFPATRRAPGKLRRRLAGHGIPVIYTRESGVVTLTLKDHAWSLRTADGGFFSSSAPPPVAEHVGGDEPEPRETPEE